MKYYCFDCEKWFEKEGIPKEYDYFIACPLCNKQKFKSLEEIERQRVQVGDIGGEGKGS